MWSTENKMVSIEEASTQRILLPATAQFNMEAYVLRLDKIHPVVSGNKWFKLKYYIDEAKRLNRDTLLTWGGAYSNHIVATAYAAGYAGFGSIGIIRGERSTRRSHTLITAESYGMKLHFISRQQYAEKQIPASVCKELNSERYYEIPEGGAGEAGVRGCSEITKLVPFKTFSHVICATGTGTMCRGLLKPTAPDQQVIAIHVLKGMNDLLTGTTGAGTTLGNVKEFKNYHFGGYAKMNSELISFMNKWYHETGIPSDFVYTGKMFYAFNDLLKTGYFPEGSKVLIIHSGGLQGNLSLTPGTLVF